MQVLEQPGYIEAKEHFEGIAQGLYRSEDIVKARATIEALDMVFGYFERSVHEEQEILKQINEWKNVE